MKVNDKVARLKNTPWPPRSYIVYIVHVSCSLQRLHTALGACFFFFHTKAETKSPECCELVLNLLYGFVM